MEREGGGKRMWEDDVVVAVGCGYAARALFSVTSSHAGS